MADSIFSTDGQERTRALRNAEASLGDFLNYYLGPTGIPERLGLVSQGVDMMSPASAMNRSMAASGQGDYGTAALEGAGVVAPAGIAAALTKMGRAAAPLVATAIDEAEAGVRALFAADMLPGQTPDVPVAQTAPAPEPLAPPPERINPYGLRDEDLDWDEEAYLAAQDEMREAEGYPLTAAEEALIDVDDIDDDIDWDIDDDIDDDYWDAQEAMLARGTPVQELLARQYEGYPLTAAEEARVQEYRTQQQQLLNQQLGPTLDEMGPADPAFFPPDIDDFPPIPHNDMGLMPDEADEYGALQDGITNGQYTEAEVEDALNQLNELREIGRRRLAGQEQLLNPPAPAAPEPLAPPPAQIDLPPFQQDQFTPRPASSVRFDGAPLIGSQEGLASLYSPTRKAVDLLDRPTYDNIDSLRVQLLNRGAKPDEVERVMARIRGVSGPISREQIAQAADEQAGELFVRRVNADNTPYGGERRYVTGYFVPGAENLQGNVIEMPAGSAPNFAESHFSGVRGVPVVHTRTGRLWSDRVNSSSEDMDSFHVGEIQSDWAQRRSKMFADENALKAGRERHRVVMDELDQVYRQSLQRENELYSVGKRPEDDPEWKALKKQGQELEDERLSLFNKIGTTQTYGFRGDFDAKYPDTPGYVKNTDKWVQLALRQSLLDAVNSGARQMSLSTGEMVRSYTGGKLKGQQAFYDGVVIDNLNEVLKKFAKEAGIKKPEVEMSTVFGKEGEQYVVPVVRFTDEFKEAVRRVGLPAFAKGGIVKGSMLDIDIFE